MLKSSQVNASLLIFYMGLKICHEDLLTYVVYDEDYRYFFQIVFLHTRFYKNIAGLVLKDTLRKRKYISQDLRYRNSRVSSRLYF